jgi:hypothetical protein
LAGAVATDTLVERGESTSIAAGVGSGNFDEVVHDDIG